jgi:hypothetical protein
MPLRGEDTSHSNHQLNLFNTLETSIAAIVIASSIHAVHTATDQPPHPEALENGSSSNGGGAGSIRPTDGSVESNERASGRSSLSAHGGAEDGLSRSARNCDGRVELVTEPTGNVTSRLERDFRISSDHVLGSGNLLQKAAANLEAIRLLQRIERDGRPADKQEKDVLVRYTGWGALPQMFHPHPAEECLSAAEELKSLLNNVEYESAKASTPNAHYTSSSVIQAIWNALLHFGAVSPVKILEPALGIGHFFGLMPAVLEENATRVGIELDSISARIARLLYPDSSIREGAFESISFPNSFFDLVVGNVPFG